MQTYDFPCDTALFGFPQKTKPATAGGEDGGVQLLAHTNFCGRIRGRVWKEVLVFRVPLADFLGLKVKRSCVYFVLQDAFCGWNLKPSRFRIKLYNKTI